MSILVELRSNSSSPAICRPKTPRRLGCGSAKRLALDEGLRACDQLVQLGDQILQMTFVVSHEATSVSSGLGHIFNVLPGLLEFFLC